MVTRRFDAELIGKNYIENLGLTPEVIKTWDSELWRGPRLLVPIRVEALVVTDENADGPWADVRLNPSAIPGYNEAAGEEHESEEEESLPEPFDTYRGHETGIHLHWALPDGLTQGVQERPQEPDPPDLPTEADLQDPIEHDDQPNEPEMAFPVIPDRWLVVRMSPGSPGNPLRRLAAWVIESEELDPEQRITPLSVWREDRGKIDKRWLTALGKGDPAFSAYYDNVKGVLGFHDALQNIPSGPLSYLVVGWYSRVDDDPIYAPANEEAWFNLLDELGWSLMGERESQEQRIKQAKEEAKQKLNAVGLQAFYEMQDKEKTRLNLSQVRWAQSLTGQGISPIPADTSPASEIIPYEELQFSIDASMKPLQDSSEATTTTDLNEFAMYWPRQILCHGMVYCIHWQGPDAHISGEDASPSDVKVAVGNTAIEALSALIAHNRDQDNLEQVTEAFHYGLLDALEGCDGLANLESLLHSADFASSPGGYIIDTIDEGDLIPPESRFYEMDTTMGKYISHALQYKSDTFDQVRKSLDQETIVNMDIGGAQKSYTDVNFARGEAQFQFQDIPFQVGTAPLQEMVSKVKLKKYPELGLADTIQPRKTVPFRRAMPRYYEPNDPVILLTNAGRAYKHGEDGYYSEDNRLACRITGETLSELAVVIGKLKTNRSPARARVTPADICADDLQSGQIPEEIGDLVAEALLLDHSNADVAAYSLGEKLDQLEAMTPLDRYDRQDLTTENLERAITVEQTLPWNLARVPMIDPQTLLAISGLLGVYPSPICQTIWRQPWTPLHLSWEVTWHPSKNQVRDWQLQEHEFNLLEDAEMEAPAEDRVVFSGRTLLTPSVTRVLADQINKFLESERKEEQDLASEAEEKALGDILEELRKLDVLSTSLGGLHDLMIGVEPSYLFEAEGEDLSESEEGAPEQSEPVGPILPVRAGHLRLSRLRITDAFSRYVDIDLAALNAPIRAEDLRSAKSFLLQMPPRIVQPSRLMFRFRQAQDDTKDATKLHTPICGWLLPDHLDEALEVFDSDGVNQGQIQLSPDDKGVTWFGVPGKPAPLGAPPQLTNPVLQRFVEGLLARGAHDSLEEDVEEPVLPAFLRMIDATLWKIDPLGREGDEHLSVLVGRPLAVVRSYLRLELRDAPLTEELTRTPFPVRLGALTCLYDGLIGYFVNDDYDQFYPVHEEIADQTRPTRPHQGFLGAIQTVEDYYQNFAEEEQIDPVKHSYINRKPVIHIRPNQTVMLTLLVDPRGAVNATAGFLPRKRIELMREHVAQALDNIAVTFKIGPILSDPETIRMPLPAEIKGSWTWVWRTAPTVWREDPVINATQEALLSPTPAQISEGWLKITGAFQDPESEKDDSS